MKLRRLGMGSILLASLVGTLPLVACGISTTVFVESTPTTPFIPPTAGFVNAVVSARPATASRLLQTYRLLLAAAFPSTNDEEFAKQIQTSSPRTMLQALATRSQVISPTPSSNAEVTFFGALPSEGQETALLWRVFMAGASEAWAVDLTTTSNNAVTDFVATTLFGSVATTREAGVITSSALTVWSTRIKQLFDFSASTFDSWINFESEVSALFKAKNNYETFTTRLQKVVSTPSLVRVDEVLSTPLDAFSRESGAFTTSGGGRSIFNQFRPFSDSLGAPVVVNDDDLYLVPNTYRGNLWAGPKKGGEKQVTNSQLVPVLSSVSKPNWSEWSEPVFQWGHGDSVYVLFDNDATDGITPVSFTRNFFVYDSGAYDDMGGLLYQNYLATGNYINPLKLGYENDLWIAFRDGKSNAALSQENTLPINFVDAMAKVKQQVTVPIYKALEDYYAKGASELFKPTLLKQGLFTYHQVATNAMRVVFHNPLESENPPVADQVAIKSARFILTNAVNNHPATPLTQQYATFAFGKLAARAYESGTSKFALAKFD